MPGRGSPRLPTDAVEQLCLTNVVQQLDHLRAHESVARRLADGTLQLHGMYFHVGEAQAYLLTEDASAYIGIDEVFDQVGPGEPHSPTDPYPSAGQYGPTHPNRPSVPYHLARPGHSGDRGGPFGSDELERTRG